MINKKIKLIRIFLFLNLFYLQNAVSAQATPKFLTLPFKDDIVVLQGWIYTWDQPHRGIDYDLDLKDEVLAAADGIAMGCNCDGTRYGNIVLIQHNNGYTTLYGHLDSIPANIKTYDYDHRGNTDYEDWTPVKRGDVIGYAGKTETEVVHLHFEAANDSANYNDHVTHKTDPYDLEKKAPYYPPNDKYTSSGPNHLWTVDPPVKPDVTIYLLKVLKDGTGTGTITSNPPGINCGADCEENYSSGTAVTLIPRPSPGSIFVGWSQGCSGTGNCQLVINENKSPVAKFDSQMVRLDVSTNGSGQVNINPPDIDCRGTCSENYVDGTSVHLTADADTDWKFVNWSGNCSGSNPTCSVLMNQSRSATANFDIYIPTNFTDDPIVPGETVVKEIHIRELRDAINNLRNAPGIEIGTYNFTDPGLGEGDVVRAIHIQQLRSALEDVYTYLGRTHSPYTDPSLSSGTEIKAAHINEIRTNFRAVQQ